MEASEPGTFSRAPGLRTADFPPLITPSRQNMEQKQPSVPLAVSQTETEAKAGLSLLPTQDNNAAPAEIQQTSSKSMNNRTVDLGSAQSSTKVDGKMSGHARQKSEPPVSTNAVQSESKRASSTSPPAIQKVPQKSFVGNQPPKTDADSGGLEKIMMENPSQKGTPISDQTTFVKPNQNSAAPDSLKPTSSGMSNSQPATTAPRNPRTLRLVPTTKIDVPQKSTAPPPEISTSISTSVKQVSQPSNPTSAKQPSTPVQDIISDNASLTSASLSRPPSPPGAKISATPTLQKSRNQAKKERQARAKQLEEAKAFEESASSPLQEEVVQAPIVGRKKKTKKPKTTPAIRKAMDSEVSSPQVEDLAANENKGQDMKTDAQAKKAAETTASKTEESEADNDGVFEPISVPARPVITPASIFPELKKAGALDMFLNPAGLNSRFETHVAPDFSYEEPATLSALDRQTLDKGECVAKRVGRSEYAVVLPDRTVLRHFTREEAQRYVELRKGYHESTTSSFNSPEFPADAWLNFTSNDLLSGHQVAPPLDNSDDDIRPGSPEALIREYGASIMRPDSKDAQYVSLYPPRTQSENDEIEARMAMMTTEEAEQSLKSSEDILISTRKEAEGIEKKLNQTLKKNRKILKDFM